MTVVAFTTLLAEVGDVEPDAARVGDACARHLAGVKSGDLPANAQPPWREVAKLLKGSADTPLPQKSFAAIASWPSSRIVELLAQLRKILAILDKHENERLEDEIRDKIRRHYL